LISLLITVRVCSWRRSRVPASLFLDESKARGYLLAATILSDDHATETRAALRSLVMPGQRRIHFAKESDRRRRSILAHLRDLETRTRVYGVTGLPELLARQACLEAAAVDAIGSATRLVLEIDSSIASQDRRILSAALGGQGPERRISFVHESPGAEPLLWVPDAVAWCVARRGEWRRRAEPLIAEIRTIRR